MLDKPAATASCCPPTIWRGGKDGWYFWKAPFFTAEAEPKGPYGSIMSACMMIARELAREAASGLAGNDQPPPDRATNPVIARGSPLFWML